MPVVRLGWLAPARQLYAIFHNATFDEYNNNYSAVRHSLSTSSAVPLCLRQFVFRSDSKRYKPAQHYGTPNATKIGALERASRTWYSMLRRRDKRGHKIALRCQDRCETALGIDPLDIVLDIALGIALDIALETARHRSRDRSRHCSRHHSRHRSRDRSQDMAVCTLTLVL